MRHRLAARSLAALVFLATGPAVAAETCFVPYSEFEEAVPHVDLATCPGEAASADDEFCRLAVTGDLVHVYRFRHSQDDACLEQVESLPFADFAARYGTRYTAN